MYIHYSNFFSESEKCVLSPERQKVKVVERFLHYGIDHIEAARILFEKKNPALWHSAGILCHFGIELLLKSIIIWLYDGYDTAEFKNGHSLSKIVSKIDFLKSNLSQDDEDNLQAIDKLFKLRYPLEEKEIFNDSSGLFINDTFGTGEIGEQIWPKVENFYEKIFQNLPLEIYHIYCTISPVKKGRGLLRKCFEK